MAGKKSNQARFPIARIKKLIQADEDVGKVAQGTPIVLSKALELFLAHLVEECVKDAGERGSKKITAYGLKRTITKTETFDFCSDIVESVPDPIGDDGEDGVDGDGKKKKKQKRKAKVKAEGDSGESKKRKKAVKKVEKKDSEDEEDEEEEGGGGEEEGEEEVVKNEEGSEEEDDE